MEIVSSKLNWETLFYFFNMENFVVSDDFWQIVDVVQPEISDIDLQAVKEFIVLKGYPLFHACCMHQAIDRLDLLLDQAMKEIRMTNIGATFGVGLSGGLDSRLVAHYALNSDMKLRSSTYCEKRPHKLLLSRDHANARKLAEMFNLDHSEVEHDDETFEPKLYVDVESRPICAARMLNPTADSFPAFDILLTGFEGGELLGSRLNPTIPDLSKNELLTAIVKEGSLMYRYKAELDIPVLGWLLKALSVILGTKETKEEVDRLNGTITEEEWRETKRKISQFISEN